MEVKRDSMKVLWDCDHVVFNGSIYSAVSTWFMETDWLTEYLTEFKQSFKSNQKVCNLKVYEIFSFCKKNNDVYFQVF